jgi:hypothetical protein
VSMECESQYESIMCAACLTSCVLFAPLDRRLTQTTQSPDRSNTHLRLSFLLHSTHFHSTNMSDAGDGDERPSKRLKRGQMNTKHTDEARICSCRESSQFPLLFLVDPAEENDSDDEDGSGDDEVVGKDGKKVMLDTGRHRRWLNESHRLLIPFSVVLRRREDPRAINANLDETLAHSHIAHQI